MWHDELLRNLMRGLEEWLENLRQAGDYNVRRSTPCPKKGATILMAVTSSNLNRFSKFFHHWKENKISNKIHILFPTTP